MKRNYAFVQFENIDISSKAKEGTNGGKLNDSTITVEFVARQRRDGGSMDRGDYRRGGGYRDRDRDRDDYRDRDGYRRGRGPPRADRGRGDYRSYDRDRYDRRSPGPPSDRGGSGGGGGGGGGGRYRRSRSRSFSPPYRGRSRSPRRGGDYYDDRDERRYDRGRSPDDYRRERSNEREYRGGGGGSGGGGGAGAGGGDYRGGDRGYSRHS
eukprot:CAMPEP_0118682144 /NCGR_PEP_ID=MMETSP0800-20121206/5330_1 /TAXON_ID=210618 ORGANISM="Striatella unipunctata, Strain CCMP2910" /NCGR_SAMPLE_ID=MMETSP0800 /ASSEMBLY_ACC=CAM_ASM_000638 /LENGTH=209 /DNA_ID=CAMNT_0006578517 /DNA_START=458 /DNA_END=1087 /DNA_ORIENTATION=-